MNINQAKIASAIMVIAVILGAFGAHSLKAMLSADRLQSWKTGVLYMVIHGLILFVLSVANTNLSDKNQKVTSLSYRFFLIGILLFSGSIFLLSTQDILGINTRWLGPITPIGGILFILGWSNLIRLQDQP